MENQEKPHKRRVRYSGTHPKRFSEKYKEHQPEKYADVVEKVIRKGSTPAGMHISICEGNSGFSSDTTGTAAWTLPWDMGHTLEMLKCLKGEGHIYGLDVDPIESEKTKRD